MNCRLLFFLTERTKGVKINSLFDNVCLGRNYIIDNSPHTHFGSREHISLPNTVPKGSFFAGVHKGLNRRKLHYDEITLQGFSFSLDVYKIKDEERISSLQF